MNFPVAELKQRYGIGKQADINRRKHLNITPKKVDGVYVIDDSQLSLLDKLDKFLRSAPKAKMADFDSSTGDTVLDATIVDSTGSSDNGSLLVPQVNEEQTTDLVHLVETIASAVNPNLANPISHWERLKWLADNQIIISTSEVEVLVGTKPKGNPWFRGSFVFERAGKIGSQTGWKVAIK